MQQTVTFIVDSNTLEIARQRAEADNTTLNALFQSWMEQFLAQPVATTEYREFMPKLNHVDSGRRFDRDEMNERR